MAKPQTTVFAGLSGKGYQFYVYPMGTSFKPVGGVYVFAIRRAAVLGGSTFDPVYIGQTGDLSERFEDHHKMPCIRSRGANYICVRVENAKQDRLWIEADLIRRYKPPCNG